MYNNGAYKSVGTSISQFMHDFKCVEAKDMHNKVLADRVKYFKETEGGREEMCKIMEDLILYPRFPIYLLQKVQTLNC